MTFDLTVKVDLRCLGWGWTEKWPTTFWVSGGSCCVPCTRHVGLPVICSLPGPPGLQPHHDRLPTGVLHPPCQHYHDGITFTDIAVKLSCRECLRVQVLPETPLSVVIAEHKARKESGQCCVRAAGLTALPWPDCLSFQNYCWENWELRRHGRHCGRSCSTTWTS